MNEPTPDERTVKAWRDIVHATVTLTADDGSRVAKPDPRPVNVTRTALAPLLDLAERALELAAMQQRLDMLVRVLGDEAHFAIAVGHEDAWPDGHEWAVQVTTMQEYGGYKESISFNDERTTSFSAVTLPEAVRLAWVLHGSPVECAACSGNGEFVEFGTAEEMAAGKVLAGRLQTHHDGSAHAFTRCGSCKGEGMFFVEVPPCPA